jgi:hemolysin activation/secretion protein
MQEIRTTGVLSLGAMLAFSTGLALAQQPPDAGRLLREQPKPPAAPPAKPAAPKPPPGELQDTGLRVLVKAFRIQGATLIPEAELAEQIRDRVGKEQSFSDLRAAARTLVRYYASKGFSARVILPEQDIREGLITLRVIEGKRGALRIEQKGEGLDTARIERIIDRRVPAGAVMNLEDLGEAVSIVNELPGVSARSVLSPGKAESEVDVRVAVEPSPPRTYSVQANNQGSRGTGSVQGGFGATFNNPTGRFDRFGVITNASEGSAFVRGEYGIALGDNGLLVGASASHLAYRLTQSSFAALRARGTASTVGLNATYPVQLRTALDLRVSGGLDRRELVDRTINGQTGDRVVQVANLGTSATFLDPVGGDNTAELRVYAGNTRQHDAAARAADQAARNVEGSFGKLEYSLDRVQELTPAWNFGFSLRGQVAGKNLDSSERMGLGGPNGVRAYPTGEAYGDHATLLTLALSHSFHENVSASVFLDHGWVRLNHSLWNNWNAANPQLRNTYSLSGVGVGLNLTVAPGASLRLSVAQRIGDNPGRDAAGNDADGSRPGPRGWVGFVAQF